MKRISHKELFVAIKEGVVDRNEALMCIVKSKEPALKDKPNLMVRLIEQLKVFTETVGAIPKAILLIHDVISKQMPVKADSLLSKDRLKKPKKWSIKVTGYNKDGRISEIDIVEDNK